MPKKNGMEIITSKRVVTWLKMNGFTITKYNSWFYLKADGSYADQEWQKINGKWYYFKKIGAIWLKVSGKEIIS